jgi:hypothetical protein
MSWLKRKLTDEKIKQLLLGKEMEAGPFKNGKVLKYGGFASKEVTDFLGNFQKGNEIWEFELDKRNNWLNQDGQAGVCIVINGRITHILVLMGIHHWLKKRLSSIDVKRLLEGEVLITEPFQMGNEKPISTMCMKYGGYSADDKDGFIQNYAYGDEVWEFESERASWKHLAGRAGICIVRSGKMTYSDVLVMS